MSIAVYFLSVPSDGHCREQIERREKKKKHFKGDLLRSKEVVTFLQKIDGLCEENLLSVFSDFKNVFVPKPY